MESLTIAEIGRDTLRVELASMLEVLYSFSVLAQLTKQCCVV